MAIEPGTSVGHYKIVSEDRFGRLTVHPNVDDLRSDPRFAVLMKKIQSSRLE